jgi:hypothetical protein
MPANTSAPECVHGFPRDEHDDMREAWMAVGAREALLSHQSALALLGLSDEIPDAVHLLVPQAPRASPATQRGTPYAPRRRIRVEHLARWPAAESTCAHPGGRRQHAATRATATGDKTSTALDFRLCTPTRSTKDIDLGRDDDEEGAVQDIVAAQELMLNDFFTFAARRTSELDDTARIAATATRGARADLP